MDTIVCEGSKMERAKELFLHYNGNQYYMDLNGDGNEYRSYRVPKETEEAWRREYLDHFFEQKSCLRCVCEGNGSPEKRQERRELGKSSVLPVKSCMA